MSLCEYDPTPLAGRWRIVPDVPLEGSMWGNYLRPDDASIDEPVLMFRADGTGTWAGAEDYIGTRHIVHGARLMPRDAYFFTLCPTREKAKAANYYCNDITCTITLHPDGTVTTEPFEWDDEPQRVD